ncbi:MAG: DUF1638 domain-containing protein [Hyphomicrobiales bacterium]|nr:DUF1638 domain-containing protein [Hyphomicrobiales bacterium]
MAKTNINNKQEKTRIIACGMIAREVLAINEQLGTDSFDLKCLPADFHHHPERIAPAMNKAIIRAREEGYENIIVGYAECGTGGKLDKVCEKHGVERIKGPHCFSFYIGNQQFIDRDGDFVTTFFMTDFLARHFENFLIKPLGLDRRPELRDIYFSNYSRVLYLAQTDDRELDKKAEEAAKYLGLKYERISTGYGDLATTLAQFPHRGGI